MKFLTIIITSLTIGACCVYGSEDTCPSPWRFYQDKCYLFYSGEKTFFDSEMFCRNTSIKNCRCASLVSIADMDEFIFVRDLVYSITLEPVAFYMGGYTTDECPSGAWTDESQEQPICTGDKSENSGNCDTLCDFDKDSPCNIQKCMVSSVESWLYSLKTSNMEFSAMVGDFNCTHTKLPFVCETSSKNTGHCYDE